jgi:hypothetical protein
MNVGCFKTWPEATSPRVVNRQGPVCLLTRIEFIQSQLKNRNRKRFGLLSTGLKQFIKEIPVVVDARTMKPTIRCSPSTL